MASKESVDGWDSAIRQNFANDFGHEMSLIAVTTSSSRSKGASDLAEWMVLARAFKCEYMHNSSSVKLRSELRDDYAEASALEQPWKSVDKCLVSVF